MYFDTFSFRVRLKLMVIPCKRYGKINGKKHSEAIRSLPIALDGKKRCMLSFVKHTN